MLLRIAQYSLVCTVVACLGLVLGCTPGGSPGDGEGGGVVNVYTHRHYDADKKLFKNFTDQTGIAVNVVQAGADELIKRLETEGENSPADVLITVDAGRLVRAKQKGLLQPAESATLNAQVPEASAALSREIVAFVQKLRSEDLFKKPGVAETIDWAKCLLALDAVQLSPQMIADTLGAILKYQDDIVRIQGSEAARILTEAKASSEMAD